MEEKFKVFSTLADMVVLIGTIDECKEYKRTHESGDNCLYIYSVECTHDVVR